MINDQGRNHPGGHGHPLLYSTTSDRSIRTPVFLNKITALNKNVKKTKVASNDKYS